MSLEYRMFLLAKAVTYRGQLMSRAQRRDAAEGGAYYSAPRVVRGQKVTRRSLRNGFLDGSRGVIGVGAPAGRVPGKTRASIGRRLKKAGAGHNAAAFARSRAIAKRRKERPGTLALRDGRIYRIAQPRPFRNSLRGGGGDLMEAARMGRKPKRASRPRKPRQATR